MCQCIRCLIQKHDISELKKGQGRTGEQMQKIWIEHEVSHENYDKPVKQSKRQDARSKRE